MSIGDWLLLVFGCLIVTANVVARMLKDIPAAAIASAVLLLFGFFILVAGLAAPGMEAENVVAVGFGLVLLVLGVVLADRAEKQKRTRKKQKPTRCTSPWYIASGCIASHKQPGADADS